MFTIRKLKSSHCHIVLLKVPSLKQKVAGRVKRKLLRPILIFMFVFLTNISRYTIPLKEDSNTDNNRKKPSDPDLTSFKFSKTGIKHAYANNGTNLGSDVDLIKDRYTWNSNDIIAETYLGTNVTYSRSYKTALKTLKPFRPSCSDGKIPVNKAGFFSYLFVTWISPLVWRIYKHRDKPLQEEDVWSCSDWETACVNTERMERLWDYELHQKGPDKSSFLRVWLNFIRTRLFVLIFAVIINAVLTFTMEGYMTQLFVTYLEADDSDVMYALGLVAISFVGLVLRACSFAFIRFFGAQTGVRFRAGVLGLLFAKMLKLKSLKGSAMAEIVTVFGADSVRIYKNCITFIYLLALPLYLLVGTVYIYHLIGFWCFVPVGIFFLCYQLQAFAMNLVAKLRRKILVYTDERIRKMTEILTSIKFIKMYAWEDSFLKAVQGVRRNETRILLISAFIDAVSEAVILLAPTIATVATLAPYYATGHEITFATAFAIVATLNYMRAILIFTPYASRILGECKISFDRIKRVLLMEEFIEPSSKCVDKQNAIEISGATFRWNSMENDDNKQSKRKTEALDEQSQKDKSPVPDDKNAKILPASFQLGPINLTAKKGKIIGICGQVGCGKSSLVSTILGRMPLLSGTYAVSGSVAYAAQQAWIFNGTVRENILFGKPLNSAWYEEVISACCLKPDLAIMSDSDQTEIGERGIDISGGQKQRLSLARAVYSKSDVYLLDDPLSAVDVHVGRHIFYKCIKKLLKGKTVILVTHQLQYLKYCDEILSMEGGAIVEQGNHQELLLRNGYYSDMMMKFYSTTTDKPRNQANRNHSDEANSDGDQGFVYEEAHKDEINSKGCNISCEKADVQNKGKLTDEEVRAENINIRTYCSYIRALGGVGTVLIMLLGYAVTMGSVVFSDYWLSMWLEKIDTRMSDAETNDFYGGFKDTFTSGVSTRHIPSNISESSNKTSTTPSTQVTLDVYFLVYCSSVPVILIFTFMKGFLGAMTTITAARRLHTGALSNVMKAPMKFFHANPTGRILNRFSCDMDEVDVFLPTYIDSGLQLVMSILISVVATAIILPWILLSILPSSILFYYINKISSVTMRQIRRFENVARSPLLGHVDTCGQGLFTIVAFKQQKQFHDTCLKFTDVTTTGLFLFEGSMRWIGLRLDLIASVLSVTTSLVIVLMKGSISPAMAALSLSLTIRNIFIMQFMTRFLNELEARFTSVERLHEYQTEIESELVTTSNDLDSSWPQNGNLKFSDVAMKYRKDMDPVLRHIRFEVNSREKIGIVGRTGAGKSSLAVALFRLFELSEGNIYIDGVDIAEIPRNILRSKLSIIPQDPVLFAGTLRYNLDPFDKYNESELWSALEQVKMKEKVKVYDRQLDYKVEENGENFSVGERQLICLARTILRRNKILILDEATASIDTSTDAMIQQTIRESFADCTVLTIAHRLNTVLNCDRVFIMENGQILEAGSPKDLLQNANSFFNAMIAAQTIKTSSP